MDAMQTSRQSLELFQGALFQHVKEVWAPSWPAKLIDGENMRASELRTPVAAVDKRSYGQKMGRKPQKSFRWTEAWNETKEL
jgi:hypothetical protein